MKKFNIKVNGTSYEVEVEEAGGAALAPAPRAAAPAPAAPAPAAAPAAPKAAPAAAPAGGHTINAPMPGKIVKVECSVGQSVQPGDVLLILEAMKMQNEITADVAGTVKAISVEAGQSVKVQDPLVNIG